MSYLMQNHYHWGSFNPETAPDVEEPEEYDINLDADDEYERQVEEEYDTRDLSDEGLF